MKILLLLFGILFSTFAFSQKYHFDTKLEFDLNVGTKHQSNVYLLMNSSDKSYYMEIGQNSLTKYHYGILLSNSNNTIHRFILPKELNLENNHYNHESSNKRVFKGHYKFDEIQVNRIEDLNFNVLLCKNKKNKCVEKLSMQIELMPFQEDLAILEFEPLTDKQNAKILELIMNELTDQEKKSKYVVKQMLVKKNAVTSNIEQKLTKIEKIDVDFVVEKNTNDFSFLILSLASFR